ncbi:MAG: helix-turn-helix domain-containing protein [Frankiaceae bacterium]
MTHGLGQRVLELRRRKGLSQAQLAPLVHVTSAYLSMVEQGKRQPREAVLRNLAVQLDTTVEYLITGRDGQVHAHEVDLRFGEVALSNGDPRTARERFAAAYEDAVALGDGYAPEQREAQYGLARADWTLGRVKDAIAGFEALLEAHDVPTSVSRVALQTWLCRAYTHAGDLGRAIDLGESALRHAGPLNRVAAVSDGMVILASTLVEAYHQRGDLTRAQQIIDSTVIAAEAGGSMDARGAAYWSAAMVAEARGEIRAAIRLADRAAAMYGELEFAFEVAALRGNVASLSLRLPDIDLDVAEQQLRESISGMAEGIHGPADLAEIEKELARCLLLAGRVGAAVDTARDALERVPAQPLERARVLAVLAAALLADGRDDEALATYQDAAVALEACGAGRQAAPVWRELADVLSAMGRESDANAMLRRMGVALGVPGVPVCPRASATRR